MTPNVINSGAYWDARFSENWEDFDGPRQSRFFARMAIECLPQWLVQQIKSQGLTLADWGCAQGDGADVWASVIPPQQIAGVDFSSVAIAQAAQRYPAIRFINADWIGGVDAGQDTFDVIFSSNTLEHFHRPYDVLDAIAGRARKAVVLALPYREMDRIDEHFFTFVPENIPAQLANGFRLIWSKVVDCRPMQDTLWSGDQILLVYAAPDWTAALALTLNDCHVEKDDVAGQVDVLKTEADARNKEVADLAHAIGQRADQIADLTRNLEKQREEIANLTQDVERQREELTGLAQERVAHAQAFEQQREDIARLMQAADERHDQIVRLGQDVMDRDVLLQAADAYRVDKEIYIAQLLQDLQMRSSGLPGMAWKLKQRLAHASHYLDRSRELMGTGGAPALIRAVRTKLRRRLGSGPITAGAPSPAPLASVDWRHEPLLPDELVVITGVPFDDVGGGQRAAQLARCALKTGRKVIYLYIYPKYDFAMGQSLASELQVPGLTHLPIDNMDPASLLDHLSEHATVLLELPHPKALPFLEACNVRGLRTVFELIDDWETSLGGDWFDMETYRRFVETASVVVGTARSLVQRLEAMGRTDALYLPNASNESIFDKYKSHQRPPDLPTRGTKTALYFGSLYGEWFAWDWVIAAADANPHLDIVLIGDSPGKKGLPKNIYFLGAKDIDALPGYLQHSDIALLPFVPGKISDAVSPIKVFEYLFLGKPVVSTRLPEIVGYPGVHVADTPEAFARLCNSTFDSGTHDNDRFVSRNSWFARLDALTENETRERFASSVSAVILIHDNRHIIGRCLESLQWHGRGLLREIIVVDNASSDGGADFVAEHFPDVRVVVNPVNGCASGRNLGASLATGRYLAFFDSDQWFTSGSFLLEALHILSRDASVGAIGWAAGWFDRTRTDLGGMIADFCENRAMDQEALRTGYRADIGYLGTGGFFVPRSVFNATEGFDTFYDPTCFEDTDMSFQIKRLGLKVCFRDLTGIRHQPHQTTKANAENPGYQQLFARNGAYFKEKWKAHPEFFVDYPGPGGRAVSGQ